MVLSARAVVVRPRRVLARGAAWVLVCREAPSEHERGLRVGLGGPGDFAALVAPRLAAEVTEIMIVGALNGRNQVIALAEIARGGISGLAISAADVLRVPLCAGAYGFILAHNHPSGTPEPSDADIAFTRAVRRAADAVGLTCVDHLVLARSPDSIGYSYRSVDE